MTWRLPIHARRLVQRLQAASLTDENGNLSGTTHDIAGGWMGWYQVRRLISACFQVSSMESQAVNEKGLAAIEALSDTSGRTIGMMFPTKKCLQRIRQHSSRKRPFRCRAVRSVSQTIILCLRSGELHRRNGRQTWVETRLEFRSIDAESGLGHNAGPDPTHH